MAHITPAASLLVLKVLSKFNKTSESDTMVDKTICIARLAFLPRHAMMKMKSFGESNFKLYMRFLIAFSRLCKEDNFSKRFGHACVLSLCASNFLINHSINQQFCSGRGFFKKKL